MYFLKFFIFFVFFSCWKNTLQQTSRARVKLRSIAVSCWCIHAICCFLLNAFPNTNTHKHADTHTCRKNKHNMHTETHQHSCSLINRFTWPYQDYMLLFQGVIASVCILYKYLSECNWLRVCVYVWVCQYACMFQSKCIPKHVPCCLSKYSVL